MKRSEKQDILDFIKDDFEKAKKMFTDSKRILEGKHKQRLDELKSELVEVNLKIEATNNGIHNLSHIKVIIFQVGKEGCTRGESRWNRIAEERDWRDEP